uniref:Nuclear receptor domain-containing protein n=1 Tax=Steinernema glaseri TaxID=37863 RepID=A0A1I7ZDR7_9BILA
MPAAAATQPNFLCLVCGDKSGGQHFGAEVCRACAAFFRRTVARKMKYICRYDDNCEVNKGALPGPTPLGPVLSRVFSPSTAIRKMSESVI